MSVELKELKGINAKPLGTEIAIQPYTSWRTEITNVGVSPAGTLWCTVLRPDLDISNAKGGFLSVYKGEISETEDPIIRKILR